LVHAGAGITRRRLLQAALAGIASLPCALRAQAPRIPIADMHSHYGMISRKMADSGLAEDMRNQRVALVAWKLVADGRWIRRTSTGIEQASEPAPGELAAFFNTGIERMRSYIVAHKLRTALFTHPLPAQEILEAGLAILRSADLRAVLSEIQQPTLVIHGEQDAVTPCAAGEALAQALPDARFHQIAGAGHAPFLTAPDAVATLLHEFLHEPAAAI